MQFPAQFDQLPHIMLYFQTQLQSLPLKKEEGVKLQIALEEAVVNILHYAYRDHKNPKIWIDICCILGKMLEIRIQDEGDPFNPLIYPFHIDREAPVEERNPGGLGIFFIVEMMDEVQYERQEGKNILYLRKKMRG